MRHDSTLPSIDAESSPALRVHLVAHHHLDRAAGVSGATLSLGAALAKRGCTVSYYSFDDAFGVSPSANEIGRMLRFPWRVADHLASAGAPYDVVDATTGDGWVWARRSRPGNPRAALVTRSHGLEHVVVNDLRQRARAGEVTLSRKYALYHGGFRLWEVRRSLTSADAQIFLNDTDRDYAMQSLGVSDTTSVVLPNGVPDALLDLPRILPVPGDAPISLAFVGSWIPRKGMHAVVAMASALRARNVAFTLRLLGTGVDAAAVLDAFSSDVRGQVTVQPKYEPEQLPALLAQSEVLLHPSWTEGFSLALVEGMACGLTPIATRSGGATTVIRDGENGLLLDEGSGVALADAVVRLSGDRDRLARLQVAAQEAMSPLRWDRVAAQTIDVYRAALARRRGVAS